MRAAISRSELRRRAAAQLGVDVPERDYGKLTTLDATVAYLEGRLK